MERKKGWLTSGAFAALCGTTKETLRHYKDIGLLSPAHQGNSGLPLLHGEARWALFISLLPGPLGHFRRLCRRRERDKRLGPWRLSRLIASQRSAYGN